MRQGASASVRLELLGDPHLVIERLLTLDYSILLEMTGTWSINNVTAMGAVKAVTVVRYWQRNLLIKNL